MVRAGRWCVPAPQRIRLSARQAGVATSSSSDRSALRCRVDPRDLRHAQRL